MCARLFSKVFGGLPEVFVLTGLRELAARKKNRRRGPSIFDIQYNWDERPTIISEMEKTFCVSYIASLVRV